MFDIDNYHKEFSKYPKCLMESAGRVYGVWMTGNYYKRTVGYHGEYPPSYIRRVKALFPNCSPILHVFGGTVPSSETEHTVDLNPDLKPTFLCQAEELDQHVGDTKYPLVMADPPYTKDDANKYGYPMPNTRKALRAIRNVIADDGILVWLDLRVPIFRKLDWNLLGMILLFTGTNRVVRAISIFQAAKGEPSE